MDCQGTGDTDRSDSRVDNLILFLGLTLTDVLIFNALGKIGLPDYESLEVR